MATIVLAVAAGSLGATGTTAIVASAIATTLGAYIDTAYVMPALFPTKMDRPKVGDMKYQYTEEGAPGTLAIGPECRLSGTVIYAGDVRERKTSSGGGGHGGPSVTGYEYYRDVAIYVCDGPIVTLDKMWADGRLVWVRNTQVTYTNITVNGAAFAYTKNQWWLEIESADPAIDLTKFQVGKPLTSSGWTSPATANNGTFTVLARWRDGANKTYVSVGYNTSFVTQAGQTGVTLTQNGGEWEPGFMRGFTWYTGTTTQQPDPILEAKFGVGNVPAMRGSAYVMIEQLNVTPGSGRIPNFTFQLTADAAPFAVKKAIIKLLDRAGFDSDHYNVGSLDPAQLMRGMVVDGPIPTLTALQPLLLAYNIAVQQGAQGRLRFMPREALLDPARAIPQDDLAAHEMGSERPEILKVEDASSLRLPRTIEVRFLDPERDYQTGSIKEYVPFGTSDDTMTMDVPVVMDNTTARIMARRMIYQTWANRRRGTLSLPPSYTDLREASLADVTASGETTKLFIERVERGANWLVQASGVTEVPAVFTYTALDTSAPSSGTSGAGGNLPGSGYIDFSIIDVSAFDTAHLASPGLYFACCMPDPAFSWAGAIIYISKDGGTTYELFTTVTQEATMGYAQTVLATVAQPYVVDRKNTVTVRLVNGSLTSSSTWQFAICGNEVIGFQTAALTAKDTYQISFLLRGRRNTESDVSGHAIGDRFILLDPVGSGLKFQTLSLLYKGEQLFFKAVPPGADPADYDPDDITARYYNLYPFAPTHAKATRDGTNLTVTWVRRTREFIALLAGVPTQVVPGEPTERYRIKLLNPAGSVVQKTYTVDNATTLAIPYGDLATAGYAGPNYFNVKLDLYMVGVIGEGRKNSVTL